ncbi:MAG: DNA alkylation repair protein [Candidatus Brocadiae bacterium]|nr:DNA alkylation repair protein [Candidatus Brocadiia bacterium]
MPAKTKTAPTARSTPKSNKAAGTRLSLAEAMSALEKAGSAQTRKTYARHGASEPMFGVSFATLKMLVKRIRVDHELALALWKTGNFDARNLAVKIADPAQITPADLDRWAAAPSAAMCHGYVAHLAAESPHARTRADAWLASKDELLRCSGWLLVGAMAMCDEATPAAWFAERLATIQKSIHESPDGEREAMNRAVIAIGCRDASLRKAATLAAKRIGTVEVDHGDTACKTPEAVPYIDKAWAHSTSKGFESPAAHERSRESMRTRC